MNDCPELTGERKKLAEGYKGPGRRHFDFGILCCAEPTDCVSGHFLP